MTGIQTSRSSVTSAVRICQIVVGRPPCNLQLLSKDQIPTTTSLKCSDLSEKREQENQEVAFHTCSETLMLYDGKRT